MNKEQVPEEKVKEEQMSEITRLSIIQERQGKQDHNEEHVNKYHVLEITRSTIIRDEYKSTKKKEDVRYRKVWRRNERKEEQVNKEQVQEIVLSGIVVQDESTDRNK
jgi:hypothetical protein